MNTSKSGAQLAGSDVDSVNSLLKGELSAVETYEQALAKFDGQKYETELESIREDHVRSVAELRLQIRSHGGLPAEDSGIWGSFAAAVTGAAKAIGPQTVLSALKQGEETGIRDYEKALQNGDISQDCKTLIRSDLLPKSHAHAAALERMIRELELKA